MADGRPWFAMEYVAGSNIDEYRELVAELKDTLAEERVEPLLKRGGAQEDLTNWERAIPHFLEAVRIDPKNPEACRRLAFNLLKAKRPPSEAKPHIDRAVQLAPRDARAHFVLGVCYEEMQLKKRVAAYRRALELKPNYHEPKKRLRALRWGL